MKNLSKGYLYLTLGQISVASNFIIGKFLNSELPIYAYMGGRFFVSASVFAILTLLSRNPVSMPGQSIGKKEWLIMFTQGFATGFLFNLLFFTGLEHTSATSAGIITSTLPGVLAVLSFFILKEKINLTGLAGIILSIVGVLIIGLDTESASTTQESFLGNALIFLALFPEALFSILCKLLNKKVSLLGNALIVNSFAFLISLPFMIHSLQGFDFSKLSPSLFGLLFMSGMTSVFFFLLWPRGLKSVPANIAGIFGGVLPIATGILATLFLGETFSLLDALGMVCVLGAIWLGVEATSQQHQEKELGNLRQMSLPKK